MTYRELAPAPELRGRVRWARVAAELGYADRSHMIAEFRELSSLTPEALVTEQWSHPFILDARSKRGNASQ